MLLPGGSLICLRQNITLVPSGGYPTRLRDLSCSEIQSSSLMTASHSVEVISGSQRSQSGQSTEGSSYSSTSSSILPASTVYSWDTVIHFKSQTLSFYKPVLCWSPSSKPIILPPNFYKWFTVLFLSFCSFIQLVFRWVKNRRGSMMTFKRTEHILTSW